MPGNVTAQATSDRRPEDRAAARKAADAALSRRRLTNRLAWAAGALSLALVAIPVLSVVVGVVGRAVGDWHWNVLTTDTAGNGGGLLNALEGTLLIMGGVAVIAGTIGIAGGLYLAEYIPADRGQILRGASEVLSGVPSIVLGYVGYVVLVVQFHWGDSLAAGLIVLSILVVPYVTKTTEVAIRGVPTAYREGAEALGMRSGYTLRKLVIKPALPGIATGLIVALAIAVGETAPLLFTVFFSNAAPTGQLTHSPVGYLTYLVYTFFNVPAKSAHALAADAAVMLLVLVLVLIVISRVLVSMTQRYSPERRQRVGRAPT
ncbi:MAG TPA: ABC transporter permease subunit [Acidimicrobiales bacterium]|nr:ABC transporter permease subunit [Acidimicrobiales bacterium]